MKQKKVPMRMCIGCKQMKPKRELIRIVLPKEGEMAVDITGKKNGRGSYICPNNDCYAAAQKMKGFRLPADVREQIEQEILRHANQQGV